MEIENKLSQHSRSELLTEQLETLASRLSIYFGELIKSTVLQKKSMIIIRSYSTQSFSPPRI